MNPTLRATCLLALVTTLAAEEPQKSPAPSPAPAPTFPPPSPLSAATLDELAHLSPIFDGKIPFDGWAASAKCASTPDLASVWAVKDGAMASLGAGRGVLHTKKDYAHFRLVFTMRHVSGQPDHQACVLIFCTPPAEGIALDALAGIQLQPPNGGSWDYRPGKNNAGQGLFTKLPHPKFDPHQWSQVELLVDASTGTARMAVAQPPGTKAYEVLDFKDPTAGHIGPIAWQMHNAGLFDEYKDVRLEENPAEDKLITTE